MKTLRKKIIGLPYLDRDIKKLTELERMRFFYNLLPPILFPKDKSTRDRFRFVARTHIMEELMSASRKVAKKSAKNAILQIWEDQKEQRLNHAKWFKNSKVDSLQTYLDKIDKKDLFTVYKIVNLLLSQKITHEEVENIQHNPSIEKARVILGKKQHPLYRESALIEWANSRTSAPQRSTSQSQT